MLKSLAVLSCIVVAILAGDPCVLAADVPSVPELGKMPNGKTASKEWADRGWAMAGQIPELLATDGPDDREKAIQIAKVLLKARPPFFTGTKNDGVIKFIYAKKMYAELVDLADFGIFAHPESTVDLAILQRYKVLCLTELGKHDQAIAAAKSYYNVCKLASTNDAIQLLTTTLMKADSKNAELVVQLRMQHAEGMKVGVETEKLRIPLTRSAAIDSIKVDAPFYTAAIEKITGADVLSLVARGNLLLLADRTKEAQAVFDDAYPQVDAKNAAAAAEDVARAMRACDGALARANMWLETPWPSGANGDPKSLIALGPTPIEQRILPAPHKVAEEANADPKLVEWLQMWELNLDKSRYTTFDELLTFERLLSESDLKVDHLLELLKATLARDDTALNARQLSYPPVSGAVACQAISNAYKEMIEIPNRRDISLGKISPLVRRLWLGNFRRDMKSVEMFYSMLAVGQPTDSPDWIRGMLGQAEAVARQFGPDKGMAILDQLEKHLPETNEAIHEKINFDRGLMLYGAGRFEESIVYLRRSFYTKNTEYIRRAGSLLTIAFSKTNKTGLAKEYFEEWIRRSRPDANAVARVLERVKLD